jgi:amino acid adenylation domain-containing protein
MSTRVQGFRLSPQQRQLWSHQGAGRSFRTHCTLSLSGELRADALRAALERVIARHEILRTSFRRSPGIRFPIQVIQEAAAPFWEAADLTGVADEERQARLRERLLQAERRAFDLERGPLVHAVLVTLEPERHALFLGLPAICADRRTLGNLVRELAASYAGELDDEEPVQYVQVSEWQHELLESEESRAGRDFWREQDLTPVYQLSLILAEGPSRAEGAAESVPVHLGADAGARLAETAARLGAEPADVLLAAWGSLLWRLAGGPDAGVGFLTDGRAHEDLQGAMGLFARFLPLPLRLAGDLPFREAVARIAATRGEALDYQDFYVPDEKSATVLPAGFELAEAEPEIRAGGVSFAVGRTYSWTERCRFRLSVFRGGEQLGAELWYDAGTVAAERAVELAERFRRLLGAVLADPEGAVGDVDILTGEERQRLLVDLNRTGAELAEECVHRLFERRAAQSPDRIAVRMGEATLTYAELDARAEGLARRLRASGVGPDVLVGLLVERSPEMVIALLGTLKAGGAYLPLDATHPPERLALLIEDARPAAVLTTSRLRELLPAAGFETVLLDAEEPAAEGSAPAAGLVGPDHLAYVIYTSGSTGRPKGVMVQHRGLVNYLTWAIREYGVEEGLEVPVHSAAGFDLTVTSLFAPLLAGGSLLLLPEERGVEGLGEALRSGGSYSLLKVTPAHLGLLGQGLTEGALESRLGSLIIGGEALLGEAFADWRRVSPSTRVFNEYGPTETVVGCTAYEVPPGTGLQGPVPIGRPIANTRVYILDARLLLAPFGVAGELYVGGVGVTRGYLARPDLTAERFVPDPFSAEPGARLYRTGDQVRYTAGGDLEFLGRRDDQVKIRGFRIELGEIEAALASHPGVREAVVLAREDSPGERRLVGYFLPAVDPAPNVDELRRYLVSRLPDPMVPAVLMAMRALPLTANGKVDRRALPPPSSVRPDLEREYVPPRTPLEEQLATVWSEVLGIERIGIHDSFFALGGDSIRSVRVVALLKERGLEISVESLFRHQTIADLALLLGDTETVADEERELARLVSELEGLSDEEVQARLLARVEAEEPA